MTGTRTSLFNRGVEAVRAAFGIDGVYLCPICGQQFSREALKEGQLTLEHVPPRALGGRGIILTCKACNNLAGYTVDAAITKRADMDRFGEVLLLDEVGEAGRATVQVGEERQEAVRLN